MYLGMETMRWISCYMRSDQIKDGPLFRGTTSYKAVRDDAITRRTIREIIYRLTRKAGMTGRFASHALRIGSAQSLVERGATLLQTQQAGRWASPKMVAHYTKGNRPL